MQLVSQILEEENNYNNRVAQSVDKSVTKSQAKSPEIVQSNDKGVGKRDAIPNDYNHANNCVDKIAQNNAKDAENGNAIPDDANNCIDEIPSVDGIHNNGTLAIEEDKENLLCNNDLIAGREGSVFSEDKTDSKSESVSKTKKRNKKQKQVKQSSLVDFDEEISKFAKNNSEYLPKIPIKSMSLCSQVILSSITGHLDNCKHLVYSNLIIVLLDWLGVRLIRMTKETGSALHAVDPSVVNTMKIIAHVINMLSSVSSEVGANPQPTRRASRNFSESSSVSCKTIDDIANYESFKDAKSFSGIDSGIVNKSNSVSEISTKTGTAAYDDTRSRIQDLISYCICSGVADKISWYLNRVQGPLPLEVDPECAPFIMSSISLLDALTNALNVCRFNINDDPTQLLGTLKITG